MRTLVLVVVPAIVFHVAASVAAVLVGVWVSEWLIVPLLVLFNLVALFAYNRLKVGLAPRIREADDEVVFRLCSTGLMGLQRRMMVRLPASPRCRFCQAPFGGMGRFLGIRPSGKNPNYCESCFDVLPTRSKESRVAILFADIRGFTPWAEEHSPAEVAANLSRFYEIANRTLTSDDAFVQFIGDEVMAFYMAEMPSLGEQTARIAFGGAQRLVEAIRGADGALPVGVGLGIGSAEVGAFMKGGTKDFTVVGDLVNTTARLQGRAAPFEIVMSEPFYRALEDGVSGAERTVLDLKGKADPTTAYVVSAAAN